MTLKKLTKAVQETSVIFGLVILTPLSAALATFNFKAVAVVSISFIFYIVFKLIFESREGEDERERLLNKTGKAISAAAVAICLLFSLFLLGKDRLAEKVALDFHEEIKDELKAMRQIGLTTQLEVQQGQDILKHEEGTMGLHEGGKAITTSALSVLRRLYYRAGNYLDHIFSQLVLFLLGFSTVVLFIGWVGKTILIPAQKEEAQPRPPSGGTNGPDAATEAVR